MRKVFFLLSLLFLSKISFARVPLEECFDLYHNTKDKNLSPAWAAVMLESGHLKGIRFFGDFKSEKKDRLEPHPAFNAVRDTLKQNAPQDPVSAMLQYLFPSPNGQEFAINQRQNDPIGHLSKKQNLRKVSALIQAVLKYKEYKALEALGVAAKKYKEHKALDEEYNALDVLAVEVKEIIESTRNKHDKGKKTRPVFDHIRDHFVDIFVQAILFEVTPESQAKYPDNIVTHALFAFALISADTIQEIHQHFKWVFQDHLEKRVFGKDDYEKLVALIQEDKNFEKGVNVDTLLRALMGQNYFDQVLPKGMTYVNTFYVHEGKRIHYPNCGETTLLNFFYYTWGDRGRINPDYIQITEQKLNTQKAHPETLKNWNLLKAYFRDFPNIGVSASRAAQERWSNLLSNLNRDDADPSLKVTYRQKVCNVQGIGLINMLNVLEKIIPDYVLTRAFDAGAGADNYAIPREKLTRLTFLFSRAGAELDWNVNGQKKITNPIVNIDFTLNKEKSFDWQFKNGSFSLHPSQNSQKDWRQNCAWEKTPLLLKAWVRGDVEKLRYDIDDPREIYALNLLVPEIAGQSIDKMIAKEWVHLKSIVPQIIGKTLFTHDRFARRAIYTLMHVNQGVVGGDYHPELDWKTYLPDFKEVDPKKALRLAAENGFWNIVKSYGIDMNFELDTHFVAAENGYLPIVKWIVDQRPEALAPVIFKNMYSQGKSLIRTALYQRHFEMLDYLLTKIESPQTYKIGQDSLLKLLLDVSCDTTAYLQKYWDFGLRFDVGDILRATGQRPHLQNQLWLIDKMAKWKMFFDKPEHVQNLSSFHEEALISAYQKGVIVKDLKGHLSENLLHKAMEYNLHSFARLLLDEQYFDIQGRDNAGNSLLHYAAKSGSLTMIEELLARNLDPKIENNNKQTPLHSLFEAFNPVDSIIEIAKLFLSKGLDLNQPDLSNMTPFGKAFGMPNMSLDMIRELIKIGGQLPILALHSACQQFGHSSDMEMIRFLVEECGFSVDVQDQDGQTPLHKSVSALKVQVIDYLLSQKAQADIKDSNGQNALHHLFLSSASFIRHGNNELYDWNDEEHSEDEEEEEQEVFLNTCERQKLILESLLKHNIQIDERDAKGRTAFLLAMPHVLVNSDVKLFYFFCEKGADPKVKDDEGNGLEYYLFESIVGGHYGQKYDCLSVLKKLNIDIHARNAKGETPLFVALRNNNPELRKAAIKALLELGADMNALDHDGNSVFTGLQIHSLRDPDNCSLLEGILAKASSDVRQNTLLTLLKQGLSFKIGNSFGEFRLCEDVLLWLKSMMDNQDLKHLGGFFNKAISCWDEKDLQFIFGKLGFDINAMDEEGNTLLHSICGTYYCIKPNHLVEIGANPNAQNAKGETPLLKFVKASPYSLTVDCLKEFETYRTDFTLGDLEGNNLYKLYLSNAHFGNDKDIEIIDFFLSKGCSVNDKDKYEYTILHKIAMFCNGDQKLPLIQKYVEKYNADINIPDKDGQTLFNKFYNTRELDFVFGKLGFDINAVDEEGNTFLHRDGGFCNQSTNIKLLQLGANPNAQNAKGETPLLKWVKSSPSVLSLGILKEFEAYGTDFTLADLEGNNLYKLYLSNASFGIVSHIEIIDFLLSKGFSVNDKDKDGNTILHKIISNYYSDQQLSLIQKYVEQYKADVTIPDKDGITLLEKIYEKDLALYLISIGADASLVSFLYKRIWGIGE
jgi:ankyrin repeat protein